MSGNEIGPILTIGHSNHSLERFLELLRAHAILTIGDVRSVPYSRRYPDFNREGLQRALSSHGLSYVFLGDELGARPNNPACYVGGRVQYRALAATPSFRSGLDSAIAEARSSRLALLCAEREPLGCHRAILVARELEALGIPVSHIHADGRLETHGEAMNRLLDELKLRQIGLFDMTADLFDEAYARQEERVAYSLPEEHDGESANGDA